MPANSDYYPVLDLNAAKNRFMEKSATDVVALLTHADLAGFNLRRFDLKTVLPPFQGERHKFRTVEGEGVFQVPVGPVHAGIMIVLALNIGLMTPPVQPRSLSSQLIVQLAGDLPSWPALLEKNKARPWFLYLPFNAQHAPLQATQKYLDRFAGIADQNMMMCAPSTRRTPPKSPGSSFWRERR